MAEAERASTTERRGARRYIGRIESSDVLRSIDSKIATLCKLI